ncbi:hypothetical protein N7499_012362 [Penicillium canescens]|nr:hypothetical protein N7499_012362 [Penicillium canescens]
MDGPDQIGPDHSPKRTFSDKLRYVAKTFTTREGLLGDYDYAYLFIPRLPFTKRARKSAPFFGLEDRVPVVLALILGLQHALAMLAGVISPPIMLGGSAGVNFGDELYQYLVSTSLIVSGVLSAVQMFRLHIKGTKYYIGTGLLSVVGMNIIFNNHRRPRRLHPDVQIRLLPHGRRRNKTRLPKRLRRPPRHILPLRPPRNRHVLHEQQNPRPRLPPLVTGPTVLLIGASLIKSAMTDWAGGSGCGADPSNPGMCPSADAPHALPWGSAEFIGLGFLVFVTIIICERWGPPILKSCSVIVGLLVGSIVAAACNYFESSGIAAAPVASFAWVHTFPLSVYPPLILPLLALYIVIMMESIGDITATCDVSRLQVEGATFDSRIQGGVLGNGITCLIAGLMTISPMSVFAQNNGVIALTKCANRTAGYCCCFFLVVMGVFSKFAAALVSIPSPVLGGMTAFLFSSVAVSGLRIIASVEFTRRNRFILTASFSIGMGVTLVPEWFAYFFTYSGDNHALEGLLNACDLVMENGFAVAALLGIFLNLFIPEEADDVPALLDSTESDDGRTQVNTTAHESTTKMEHPVASSASA